VQATATIKRGPEHRSWNSPPAVLSYIVLCKNVTYLNRLRGAIVHSRHRWFAPLWTPQTSPIRSALDFSAREARNAFCNSSRASACRSLGPGPNSARKIGVISAGNDLPLHQFDTLRGETKSFACRELCTSVANSAYVHGSPAAVAGRVPRVRCPASKSANRRRAKLAVGLRAIAANCGKQPAHCGNLRWLGRRFNQKGPPHVWSPPSRPRRPCRRVCCERYYPNSRRNAGPCRVRLGRGFDLRRLVLLLTPCLFIGPVAGTRLSGSRPRDAQGPWRQVGKIVWCKECRHQVERARSRRDGRSVRHRDACAGLAWAAGMFPLRPPAGW